MPSHRRVLSLLPVPDCCDSSGAIICTAGCIPPPLASHHLLVRKPQHITAPNSMPACTLTCCECGACLGRCPAPAPAAQSGCCPTQTCGRCWSAPHCARHQLQAAPPAAPTSHQQAWATACTTHSKAGQDTAGVQQGRSVCNSLFTILQPVPHCNQRRNCTRLQGCYLALVMHKRRHNSMHPSHVDLHCSHWHPAVHAAVSTTRAASAAAVDCVTTAS